jgi:hypothetical protein
MLVSLADQPATAVGLASYYAAKYPGLIDVLVLDSADAGHEEAVARTGVRLLVTNTLIGSAAARRRLAEELLTFARQ